MASIYENPTIETESLVNYRLQSNNFLCNKVTWTTRGACSWLFCPWSWLSRWNHGPGFYKIVCFIVKQNCMQKGFLATIGLSNWQRTTPLIKINWSVGRRGTNQLCLLERYLDVLVKHTTEILPPTALVEGTAPSALVEDVSLRWFILSCEYYIFISKIRAQHATSRIQETESPN